MIALLRIKGRNRINTLYFDPLPVSCRQAVGVSAGTVQVHTNIRGRGCQAQGACPGGDSDNPSPSVVPLVPQLSGEWPVWAQLSGQCCPCAGGCLWLCSSCCASPGCEMELGSEPLGLWDGVTALQGRLCSSTENALAARLRAGKAKGLWSPLGTQRQSLRGAAPAGGGCSETSGAQPCWDLGSVTVLGLSAVNTALFVFLRGVLSGTVYGRTKGINIHNFPECAL